MKLALRSIPSVFLLVALSGCASAWVVRQGPDGGTIGYRGYSSTESATKAISKLIQCPDSYQVVNDELRSSQYTYTYNQPVNVQGTSSGTVRNAWSGNQYQYQQNDSYTAYVPTTQVGTSYWREMSYACSGNLSRSLAESSTPSESCADSCARLEREGSLKPGYSAADCMRLSCK